MIRKLSLAVVLLIGVVWAAATFLFNLWGKTPALDRVVTNLKPAFSDSAVTQYQGDAKAVNGVIDELTTKTIPTLAQALKVKQGDVVTTLSTAFPHLGTLLGTKDDAGRPFADGKPYVVHAQQYLQTISGALAEHQDNFRRTADIPVSWAPPVTVAVLFLVLGLIAIAIGVAFLRKPSLARPLGAVLVLIGVVVPVVTLVIDIPGKTRAADAVTDTFRPVFGHTGPLSIDQGQAYLATVAKANAELTDAKTGLIPTAAKLLGVSNDAAAATLVKISPVVAGAFITGKDAQYPTLTPVAGIYKRWSGLAGVVVANRADFAHADDIPGWGMPTTIVTFLLIGPALLLLLAGLGWIAPELQPLAPVAVYGRRARSA